MVIVVMLFTLACRAVINHSQEKELPAVYAESFESLPGRGLYATLSGLELRVHTNVPNNLAVALNLVPKNLAAALYLVDCLCGACDDDGERMVACDECNVWRHTKCSGIEDDELAPAYFVCSDCDAKSKSELLSQ
ncbi:PHD finger protein-like protein [Tanacetum coccineum]